MIKQTKKPAFFLKTCMLGLFLTTFSAGAAVPISYPASATARDQPTAARPQSLAPMLETVTPAIVNLIVQKQIPLNLLAALSKNQGNNPNGQATPADPNATGTPPGMPGGGDDAGAPQQNTVVAVGSGVIVDKEHGLIVTNAHVIDGAKLILVTLKDGRKFRARVIGADPGFDIALLRIPTDHLTNIRFGNSDKVRVGDYAVAIGSPFGLELSVTSGVVSALNRVNPQIEQFQNFIQTDAPINPGNSGGALVNTQGELIGINTAILAPSEGSVGIGFAIPVNMVNLIVEQLKHYGVVERGMLGLVAENISPELADALHLHNADGVLITQVTPNSPAAKAGIQPKDVVLRFDEYQINNAAQLHNYLGLTRPGTVVKISLLRDGQLKQIPATIADPKHVLVAQNLSILSGVSLRNFDELEPNGTYLRGVQVINLAETSDAALGGLAPGDVITSVNGQVVRSINELLTDTQDHPKQAVLSIMRPEGTLYLVINKTDV